MDNQPNKKWYQKPTAVLLLLLFFFPAGLFLMWKHEIWSKNARWIVTVLVTLAVITNVGNNEPSSSGGQDSKSNSFTTPKPSSSPNGNYTSNVSGSGQGGQFSVSIYGDSWTSVLKLNSYDDGSYEYGTVRGKNLYDESGFVQVGSVSGNTVRMGQFSATK